MNYLIACDKFKGTLDSARVNSALAEGIRAENPAAKIRSLTVADGGQGFLQAVAQARRITLIEVPCRDARGRGIRAMIGKAVDTGAVFIESAQAIGLPLIETACRDPWLASSAGLGDLLLAASALNPACLYLGLGGSASCDGGLGCLDVLGWKFYDSAGAALPAQPCSLERIAGIEPPPQGLGKLRLICDVANGPIGARGGVRVYSPQKGADQDTVERLEAGMRNWVRVIENFLGRELADLPGGGAAGCLGLGLLLAGAELIPGAAWLLELLGFETALSEADCVITGEGAFDASSLEGKVPGRILTAALAAGKRTILVTGQRAEVEVRADTWALADFEPAAVGSAELSLRLLGQIGQKIAGGSGEPPAQ